MATSVDREQQMVRAAKGRALISAYLSKETIPATPVNLWAALSNDMTELGYTRESMGNFLFTMTKSGMVNAAKDADGVILGYSAGKGIASAVPKGAVVAKKKKENAPASIVVDVIKATGRVRISLAGMTIEIGVEG